MIDEISPLVCHFCHEPLLEPNSVCPHHELQVAIAKKLQADGKNPDHLRCGNCDAIVAEEKKPCPECGDLNPLDYLEEEEEEEDDDETETEDEDPGED